MGNTKQNKIADILRYTILALTLGIIPFSGGGFDRLITDYVLIISSVLFVVIIFIEKIDVVLNLKSPALYFLCFVIFAAISTIWSINPFRTTVETLQLVLYLLVFMTVLTMDREKQILVFKGFVIVSAFVALLGIFIYLMVVDSRMESTFGLPTAFAAFMAMSFFITFGYYIRKKNKWGGLLSVIFLTCLVLTSSRGAYFAALAAFPFVFIGIEKDGWKNAFRTTAIVLLSTAGLTAFCMFLAPVIQDGFGFLQNPLEKLSRPSSVVRSTSGRFEFWRVAWNLFLKNPIFGFGQGTFFEAYNISYTGNEWFSRFAHNHYLQTAAETGVFGIGLLAGFLLSSFLGIIKKFKDLKKVPYLFGFVAAAIMFLAHIFVDISFNYPAVSLLFFSVMGVVASHIKTDEGKKGISKYIIIMILVLSIISSIMILRSTGLHDRGLRQQQVGRIDSAIMNFEKGIKAFPLNNQGYAFLGSAYLTRYIDAKNYSDYEMAVQYTEKASALAPYNSSHHLDLGRIYIMEGMVEKSLESYEKAISCSPLGLTGYIEIAVIHANTGNVDIAFEWLKKAEIKVPYALENASRHNQENLDAIKYKAATVYTYLATIYDDYDDPDSADEYRKMSDELMGIKQE